MGIAGSANFSIDGANLLNLQSFSDNRGTLWELYRSDWGLAQKPAQWNLVSSEPNTLRGVHIHLDHEDYLFVISGQMHLGLHDLRPSSRTKGCSTLVSLKGGSGQVALVPKGVLHGFAFTEPTTYVYGLTACWTPADDIGCKWSDPELNIPWPVTDPQLSERDRNAPGLASLKARLSQSWRKM
jgi:dTDP-4-dehydrorhamnose 3,5-epimerase